MVVSNRHFLFQGSIFAILVSGRVIIVTRRFWCLSIPSKPFANKNLKIRFILKKICANVTVSWGWIAILKSKPTQKNMDTYFDNYNTIPFRRDCTAFVLRCVFHLVSNTSLMGANYSYQKRRPCLEGIEAGKLSGCNKKKISGLWRILSVPEFFVYRYIPDCKEDL